MQKSSIPKVIGITGGIGSGKSLVSNIIERFGYSVYNADDEAKKCINTNISLHNSIIELLGEEAFQNGTYNKSFVSQKVFNDTRLLQELNNIVHPAVAKHFDEWKNNKIAAFVFKEAAILFESGSYIGCDQIIVVTAPESLRIQRVMNRDGVSRDDVLKRIQKQWPESKKVEKADFIINNDENDFLIPQIKNVIDTLKADYEA